jgi:hypothetical protein
MEETMRLLTFYGGPSDGRIKPSKVHLDDTVFSEDGVYEVVANMAFFTGYIVNIDRGDVMTGDSIIDIKWDYTVENKEL